MDINNVIQKIKDCGFTPYGHDGSPSTGIMFTDGINIGHLGFTPQDGLILTTVHRPSTQVGTGYRLDGPVELTKEGLSRAFVKGPSWAYSTDLAQVRKWPNMARFLKDNPWNTRYQEL